MNKNEITMQKDLWKKKKLKIWFFGFVSSLALILLISGLYFLINFLIQNNVPKHTVEITLANVTTSNQLINIKNGEDCLIKLKKDSEFYDYVLDIKLGDNRLVLGKDYTFNNETGVLFINGQSIVGNGEKLSISAKAFEIWNGVIETGYASGNGDENNPYIISNGKQLAYLAQQVNTGETYSGKYFKLAKDIYLNDETFIYDTKEKALTITNNQKSNYVKTPSESTEINATNYWTPIGIGLIDEKYMGAETMVGNIFSGNFDGDNHIISGIYINDNSTNLGLFGKSQGLIKNLGIVNSYIKGNENIGSFCGYIQNGNLSNCYSDAIISGNTNVGGLCGFILCNWNVIPIKNCFNSGIVVGEESNIGGLFGRAYSTEVEQCYNRGIVKTNGQYTGGIIGYGDRSDLTNSFNLGDINGNVYVGGLCGVQINISSKIINCYNIGNITGNDCVGGLSGKCSRANVVNNFNTGTISSKISAGGIVCRLTDESIMENCSNFGNIVCKNDGTRICTVGGICASINDDSVLKYSYNFGNIQFSGDEVGNLIGYDDGDMSNCYNYNSIGNNPITTNITTDITCLISYSTITDAKPQIPTIDTPTLVSKLNLKDNTFKVLIIEKINGEWQLDGQTISLESYGFASPELAVDGAKIIAFAFNIVEK